MSNELARRDAGSAVPARISLFNDKGKDVQAIVRYGKSGVVRALHVPIPLSMERKELWKMGHFEGKGEKKKWVDEYHLTAVGLDKANAAMGVKLFKPPTLYTDRTGPVQNPLVERNDRNVIQRVTVRRIAVWRNVVGNLCCRDLTLIFDLATYFAQDCWAKWQPGYNDNAPKTWGKVFVTGQVPPDELGPKRLSVDMPAGVTLVMNIDDKTVMGLIGERTTREKFAVQIAQTNCDRNLIRKALGARTVDANGAVMVTSWIEPDTDLEEIAAAAENIKERIGQAYGEQVDVEVEQVAPGHDDIDGMIDVAVDADEPSDVPEPSAEPEAPDEPPPDNAPSNIDILADDLQGHNPDKTIKECRERITRWCKILYKKVPDHLTDEQVGDARKVIGEGKVSM